MSELKLDPAQFSELSIAVSAVLAGVVNEAIRRDGVATANEAMKFAGVKSRTTLLQWERDGIFPNRVTLHGDRVGYLWSELLEWRDSLKKVGDE